MPDFACEVGRPQAATEDIETAGLRGLLLGILEMFLKLGDMTAFQAIQAMTVVSGHDAKLSKLVFGRNHCIFQTGPDAAGVVMREGDVGHQRQLAAEKSYMRCVPHLSGQLASVRCDQHAVLKRAAPDAILECNG